MKAIMKLKDPVSSLTHYFGAVLSVLFGIPLITKGFHSDLKTGVAMVIFVCGMIMLYTASGTYHAISSTPKVNRILKKLDHSMIFVLIAASYTPICLISLQSRRGTILLSLIWGIALLGITLKMFIVYHPRWISSVLYIMMGWLCIFQVKEILTALTLPGFLWLLAGGVLYTVGGVIYAMKLQLFNARHHLWGSHEIFHIFVLLGSACHWLIMYVYIA